MNMSGRKSGFTIVELLIVIVVIAILAAVILVGYRGVTGSALEVTMRTDLRNAADMLDLHHAKKWVYPGAMSELDETISPSGKNEFSYRGGGGAFCLSISNPDIEKRFHIDETSSVLHDGDCPVFALTMQKITRTNCPTERTLAKDFRDSRTYWVQKLADGECWMLTDLAYAGGGSNEYNDTVSLVAGTGDTVETYTQAKYYVDSASNPTAYPQAPSQIGCSNYTCTEGQAGYRYNFCATMGAQAGTSACSTLATPAHSRTTTVCPAGWMVPGSFVTLNNAINGGVNVNNGTWTTVWLAGRGGDASHATRYWTSLASGATTAMAYEAISWWYLNVDTAKAKSQGNFVRCIAG